MKPIIIGAGRGRRLGPLTEEIPKTLVPIVGKPMLEHILGAFEQNGIERDRFVFISGYLQEVIEQRYPSFEYVRNDDWPNNNILASLLCARNHLLGGFISTYSDIVYRAEAVQKLLASDHDIALVCDSDWRKRYEGRSDHPETDAEKMRVDGDRIVELSRNIASDQASGEFIGVMKMSAAGAAQFLKAYDKARAAYADDDEFCEGRTFKKAYLIDLLQRMIADGIPMHAAFIDGGYMEIDTTQDASLAEGWWSG